MSAESAAATRREHRNSIDMPASGNRAGPSHGISGPEKSWLAASLRSASPNSPFLLSAAAELDLAAGVQRLTASSDGGSGWSVHDSEKLYSITGWGNPYFGVSDTGHVTVKPQGGERARELPSDISALRPSSRLRLLVSTVNCGQCHRITARAPRLGDSAVVGWRSRAWQSGD